MKFAIKIMLKPEILDTQGKALQQQLESQGFQRPQDPQEAGQREVRGGQKRCQLKECRVGKFIELEVEGASAEEVKAQVEAWALKWLHNPLMETYEILCEDKALKR